MSETVRALWKYRTGDEAVAVAITADGEYVVGGSHDGYVYFFHRDGRLLWRYKVAEGEVFRLALAEGAQRIAVGTLKGKYVTILDYDGQLVWQQPTGESTWGAAISDDGSLVCGGSFDDHIYLWDGDGRLLWKYPAGDDIRRVEMTPDGEYIVAGSDDHYVYMLNRAGDLVWKYKTGDRVWAGARITPDGEYVVAGSNDDHVYLFNRLGQVLWRHRASDNINTVAITPDGQYIAAGSNDDYVYLLDQSGRLLWRYRTGDDVYGVAISADGQFVVATSYDRCAYLFNAEGEVLYKYETQHETYGVAITPNGRYFAVGSRDHCIYLFENLLAPEETAGAGRKAIIEPRRVIQRIRRAYISNPYLGLACWFEEFDQQVARGRCEVCQELLKEVREQDYPFTRREWAYVDNREGVLWLRQGITHHQNGEYDQARTCYERSLEIQKRLRHAASRGQVEMALKLLQHEQDTGQRDPLLDTLPQSLIALGGSTALLCGRLDGADANECRQIIQAAVQLHLTRPLAQAARSGDVRTRMVATAALGRFIQLDKDEIQVLLSGVEDRHWFTRWRAAEAVGQHAEAIKSYAPALSTALEQETDPEVRRTLALALGNLGDRCATPSLAQAIGDADPEVRLAAAQALAQAGDRRALPALRGVADGKGFLGASIKEAAQKAIESIEKRYPLPRVTNFRACRLVAETSALQTATVYWTDEPIYLLAEVIGAVPDTRLKLVCTDEAGVTVFEQESSYAALQSNLETLRSRLRSDGDHAPAKPRLVELVDTPSPTGEEKSDVHFEVGMRVRCIKDGASESTGLRAGDTGTVRALAPGTRTPIGVEWDRDVGGHDGNVRFKCAKGHGWYVEENEIEPISDSITARSISFRIIPPTAAGWPPGRYVAALHVYDGGLNVYERSTEVTLKIVNQIKICGASICLQIDASNKPRYITGIVASDTPVFYCTVLLENAPQNIAVTAELKSTDQLLERQTAKTEFEGEQYLAFCWKKDYWEPGSYTVRIRVGDKSVAVRFRVIENVAVKSIAMCRRIDDLQRPLDQTTDFSSDEQLIYCSVTVSETPPLAQVVAEWLYLGQETTVIYDCLATTEVSGQQAIAFSLSRPLKGWPLGTYAVRIAVLSAREHAQLDRVDQRLQAYRKLSDERWAVIQFTIR